MCMCMHAIAIHLGITLKLYSHEYTHLITTYTYVIAPLHLENLL